MLLIRKRTLVRKHTTPIHRSISMRPEYAPNTFLYLQDKNYMFQYQLFQLEQLSVCPCTLSYIWNTIIIVATFFTL